MVGRCTIYNPKLTHFCFHINYYVLVELWQYAFSSYNFRLSSAENGNYVRALFWEVRIAHVVVGLTFHPSSTLTPNQAF